MTQTKNAIHMLGFMQSTERMIFISLKVLSIERIF